MYMKMTFGVYLEAVLACRHLR